MKKGIIIVLIAIAAAFVATGCMQKTDPAAEEAMQLLQTENMELKGKVAELEAKIAELQPPVVTDSTAVVKEEVKKEEPKKAEPAKTESAAGKKKVERIN